jgi:hypothetical protein
MGSHYLRIGSWIQSYDCFIYSYTTGILEFWPLGCWLGWSYENDDKFINLVCSSEGGMFTPARGGGRTYFWNGLTGVQVHPPGGGVEHLFLKLTSGVKLTPGVILLICNKNWPRRSKFNSGVDLLLLKACSHSLTDCVMCWIRHTTKIGLILTFVVSHDTKFTNMCWIV